MDITFLQNTFNELGKTPAIHFTLGSGLSSSFHLIDTQEQWQELKELPFADIPGGIKSTAPGHKGLYKFFKHKKTSQIITMQVGRIHGYEGIDPWEAIQPTIAMARAGVKSFVLTNAAGSLRKNLPAGSVMIIDDHVNLTGKNPLIGPNKCDEKGEALGVRFPDMSTAWNKELNSAIAVAMNSRKLNVDHGVYLGLMGPSFETPSEVALFARWGLDAVGMSTVWEAIALNYLGAAVSGFSFISNLGAGLSDQALSHEEVEEIGRQKGASILQGLFDFSEKWLS